MRSLLAYLIPAWIVAGITLFALRFLFEQLNESHLPLVGPSGDFLALMAAVLVGIAVGRYSQDKFGKSFSE